MRARITLIGTEKYLNHNDLSLTDHYTGLTDPNNLFDASTFLGVLVERCGQLEIRTGDPNYFYNLNQIWWSKWKFTFNRWLTALAIDYRPLENYDRHEQVDESRVLNEKHTGGYTNHSSDTSSNSSYDDSTSETKTSAFNSSAYEPLNHVTNSDKASGSSNGSSDGNGSDNHTTDNTDDFEHTAYIHGNIGVTTSQQMLTSELDLGYWNLYNRMADIYANEMCVRVW